MLGKVSFFSKQNTFILGDMRYDVKYTPKQESIFKIEKTFKEMRGMLDCVVAQIPMQYKEDEHYDDVAEMLNIFEKFDRKYRELHRMNFILEMSIKTDNPKPENIEKNEEKSAKIISETNELMDSVYKAYEKANDIVNEYTKKKFEGIRTDISNLVP